MSSATMPQSPVPTAGHWRIDPGHAEVGFVGRHLMLTRVRGRFTGIDGHVRTAEDPRDSSVEVTIDMASVDSGDATRDEHLRSADLFDVDRHPTASFRSTSVVPDPTDPNRATVTGDLTIRNVTRAIELDVTFAGAAQDPWGAERAVFSARGRLNREDWGITWNMPLDTGGLLVSREIDLEIEVELLRDEG